MKNIIGAVVGMAVILGVLGGAFWFLQNVSGESRSIGIIGGADGPTAVFFVTRRYHQD